MQPGVVEDRHRIMTAVRVGAFVWDIDAGSLICDDVVLAIAGVDPAGFDGRIGTWTALIHPDDAEAVRETTQKAVSEAGPHIVEYRLRRPDGRIVQVESRGQAVRDGGDGGAARIIGTVWDMTHSWMARDPVVRALRNMNDGFFAVDEDWRLT